MAIEIERKFLVLNDDWRAAADAGTQYRQGYLSRVTGPEAVRSSVRVRTDGERAFLNIKSATLGIRRQEYEYAIPLADAEAMLAELCVGARVEKTRYHVRVGAHVWEIDVFGGANTGLIVAEIELGHEDEVFERPDWLGAEVSDDPRYYNVCLADRPYGSW
ncbi:MAG: CYTH domain-containing protein [Gammaproteobacteria bacterium]|nr:CYTH domain-containing protein [Gammaproteobacteria bacterium]